MLDLKRLLAGAGLQEIAGVSATGTKAASLRGIVVKVEKDGNNAEVILR